MRNLTRLRGTGGRVPADEILLPTQEGKHRCTNGNFVWLRPWHKVVYDADPVRGWEVGYVFAVEVVDDRNGGWEPDEGTFYLPHPAASGSWPYLSL